MPHGSSRDLPRERAPGRMLCASVAMWGALAAPHAFRFSGRFERPSAASPGSTSTAISSAGRHRQIAADWVGLRAAVLEAHNVHFARREQL